MTRLRLKLPDNMDDLELEEVLEKALKAIQKPYIEPNRNFPDKLGNSIKEEANKNFDIIINNMLDEIVKVINKQNE